DSGPVLNGPSAALGAQRLSKWQGVYLPSLSRRLSVREVGVLRAQVPDAGPQSVYVFQVVDEDSMLIEIRYSRRDKLVCWLDGFSTNGVVDGDRHSGVAALLEVTGTRQYATTLGGTKTVFVLEPFGLDVDPSGDQPAEKRQGGQRKTVNQDGARAPRLWTDTTSKFQVMAVFVTLVKGPVKLRKSDGAEITVPFERLSKEDKEWIKALR
ncbi:MAG: SHD1 domain-containing protein, partial [Planctomycetota bacterium]